MLWRLGRIAEIAFFVRVVVEVGLFHTFVCFGGRDCSRNWLCVWGSNNESGFRFIYRATRDCVFRVCWISVCFLE